MNFADQRSFRDVLGAFATGVTIVTAENGGRRYGITVNSFTSVSLDPPLILWCLGRDSERAETFRAAEAFCVNILAGDQEALAVRFSSASEIEPGDPAFERGDGPPALAGAAAHMTCARAAEHDGGDHVIIVGRVTQLRCRDEAPVLTFHRGRYGASASQE